MSSSTRPNAGSICSWPASLSRVRSTLSAGRWAGSYCPVSATVVLGAPCGVRPHGRRSLGRRGRNAPLPQRTFGRVASPPAGHGPRGRLIGWGRLRVYPSAGRRAPRRNSPNWCAEAVTERSDSRRCSRCTPRVGSVPCTVTGTRTASGAGPHRGGAGSARRWTPSRSDTSSG